MFRTNRPGMKRRLACLRPAVSASLAIGDPDTCSFAEIPGEAWHHATGQTGAVAILDERSLVEGKVWFANSAVTGQDMPAE